MVAQNYFIELSKLNEIVGCNEFFVLRSLCVCFKIAVEVIDNSTGKKRCWNKL